MIGATLAALALVVLRLAQRRRAPLEIPSLYLLPRSKRRRFGLGAQR